MLSGCSDLCLVPLRSTLGGGASVTDASGGVYARGRVYACLARGSISGRTFTVLTHVSENEITITVPLAPCSAQVLNLLLDMPGGFAEVLLERGCLPRILQLVELQLVRQAFQDGYVRGHKMM